MSPTSPINQSGIPNGAKCTCGHIFAAHGTNGKICCQCDCKEFKEEFNPKEARATSRSIP